MLSWKTWSSSPLRETYCSGVWQWVMTTTRAAPLWHAHTNKHKETDAGCHKWTEAGAVSLLGWIMHTGCFVWIYHLSDFNLLSACVLLILLQLTYWSGRRSIRNTPLTFFSGLPTNRRDSFWKTGFESFNSVFPLNRSKRKATFCLHAWRTPHTRFEHSCTLSLEQGLSIRYLDYPFDCPVNPCESQRRRERYVRASAVF